MRIVLSVCLGGTSACSVDDLLVNNDEPDGAIASIINDVGPYSTVFRRDTAVVHVKDTLMIYLKSVSASGLRVTDAKYVFSVDPPDVLRSYPASRQYNTYRWVADKVGTARLTAQTAPGMVTATGQPVAWSGVVTVQP